MQMIDVLWVVGVFGLWGGFWKGYSDLLLKKNLNIWELHDSSLKFVIFYKNNFSKKQDTQIFGPGKLGLDFRPQFYSMKWNFLCFLNFFL